jgi:DNA-binding IclR family transcriptional regulator
MRLYTRFELRNRARPHLEELARITGETCQLHVPNGTGMLVIDVAHPAKDFFLQVVPGAHMNFHANAFGKAVLAFLPPKRMVKMLPKTLERLTEQTLTTHEALKVELESVRKTGLAYDREEYVRGVHCVGAPVFNAAGAVVAGLGTTGLAAPASGGPDAATAAAVLTCAETVSKAIGYTGNRFDLWRRSGRKKKLDGAT